MGSSAMSGKSADLRSNYPGKFAPPADMRQSISACFSLRSREGSVGTLWCREPRTSDKGDPMTEANPGRVHLITGGFPPGSLGGHDHDYARLKLLGLFAERDIPASVANDFADLAKWLPVSRLLVT